MAGYSTTPLRRKLGIGEDAVVVLLGQPDDLDLGLPAGVTVARRLRRADVVITFVTRSNELERRIDRLGSAIFPDGAVWVAWPKRASGVPTDVTDHVVRQLALDRGLVDNKVCAIDATWTGLRVVWRRERRS